MSVNLHPAAILIVGALFLIPLRGRALQALVLFLPVAGFLNVLALDDGAVVRVLSLGFEFTPVRSDRLSLLFGYLLGRRRRKAREFLAGLPQFQRRALVFGRSG